MNADDFAAQLENCIPPQSAYAGLSEEAAARFRASYLCRRISRGAETDPLLDLCTNFDLSTLEMTSITLCSPYELNAQYWIIGKDEVDPIVYPKAGGVVSLRDHTSLDWQINLCALTGDGFLSAMLAAVRYYTYIIVNPEQEITAKVKALEECLSFAGRDCESYYRIVLNVD